MNDTKLTLGEAHAEAAGALCKDDGSGCCGTCGVSLSTCDSCTGVGYHRPDCPQLELPDPGELKLELYYEPEALVGTTCDECGQAIDVTNAQNEGPEPVYCSEGCALGAD